MASKKTILCLLFIVFFIGIFFFINQRSNHKEGLSPEVVPPPAKADSFASPENSLKQEEKFTPKQVPVINHKQESISDLPKVKKYKTLTLQNSLYQIAIEYSICPTGKCQNNVEVLQYSKFSSIQKIAPSRFIDENSPHLVMVDPNNKNRLGMWDKNVIVEVKPETQIESQLIDLGFQNIQKPLSTIYIATYYGDLSQIDDILKSVTSLNGVTDVQLDVKFQQRKY